MPGPPQKPDKQRMNIRDAVLALCPDMEKMLEDLEYDTDEDVLMIPVTGIFGEKPVMARVPGNGTIKHLKQRIERVTGIPHHTQRLSYGMDMPGEEMKLSEFEVSRGFHVRRLDFDDQAGQRLLRHAEDGDVKADAGDGEGPGLPSAA